MNPIHDGNTAVKWQHTEDDLWVAHFRGRFGGTVDRHRRTFAALDQTGRSIGEYRTLEVAQHELGAWITAHAA